MEIGQARTFTDISTELKPGKFGMGTGDTIRFQEQKGLYTSHKPSLAGLKRDPEERATRLQARADKISGAVTTIKAAIDREYGAGMADAVFGRLAMRGVDLDAGVKRGDLGAIQSELNAVQSEHKELKAAYDQTFGPGVGQVLFDSVAQQSGHNLSRMITLEDAANIKAAAARLEASPAAMQALQDPAVPQMSARLGASGEVFTGFLAANFEVCTSPTFWDNRDIKMNGETLAAGLALSVLERVINGGEITEQDRQDFNRVMTPYVHEYDYGHPPPMPDQFVGQPLGDQAKAWMVDQIAQRFFNPDSTFALNISGAEQDSFNATFNPENGHSLQEKTDKVFSTFSAVTNSQYFSPTTLPSAIAKVGLAG